MDLSILKTLLSMVKQPLVGLEYLVFVETEMEVIKNPDNFVCSLCTKHGNFHNMVSHLQSAGHRIKFLKTTLPAVAMALAIDSWHNLNFTELQNSLLDNVCSEVELMLGRKTPSIVKINKPEDKWKLTLSHFNSTLLNRDKPSSSLRINKDLIAAIQRKRNDLKKLIKVEEKSPGKKSKRERSRSPLREKNEGTRRSRRRSRSLRLFVEKDRSDSECISLTIERYRRKYDRDWQKVRKRYNKYEKLPELHPKYTETWNFYWLEEFYKLDEKTRDASKCDFTPNWREYWKKRSLELRSEEELEMRIKLREKMKLEIDPRDKEMLKMINDRSKLMIKDKSPCIPKIEENLKKSKAKSTPETVEKVKVGVNVKQEPQKLQLPDHMKTLTDLDLIVLFDNIESLDGDLREKLMEFMKLLETNEPERYRDLLKTSLTAEDKAENDSSYESFTPPLKMK